MTIIVEGVALAALPDSVEGLMERFPTLWHEAVKLSGRPARRVETGQAGVLYVTQKEYAVVDRADERIELVGSDDATTCHIVVLEDAARSVVCLAHVDSARNAGSLMKMVADVLDGADPADPETDATLELSLYGGYLDEGGRSEDLTLDLLAFYHRLPMRFRLSALCVGRANTATRDGVNWPVVCGLAVRLRPPAGTCGVAPAAFDLEARGPCLALRSARLFSGKESLYRVYHSKDGRLTVEPFDYRCPHRVTEWLRQSDDFIRSNFSTSPAVEPAHFAQEMRRVFQFVALNPLPMHSVFQSRKAIQFQAPSSCSGQWLPL